MFWRIAWRLLLLVERLNHSAVPVRVGVRERHEGSLTRWELRVHYERLLDQWGYRYLKDVAVTVPLSRWRRKPYVPYREKHPGSRALPFAEEPAHSSMFWARYATEHGVEAATEAWRAEMADVVHQVGVREDV